MYTSDIYETNVRLHFKLRTECSVWTMLVFLSSNIFFCVTTNLWRKSTIYVLGVYHQVPYLWTEGTDSCSEPFFLQVFSQPSLPSSQHQSLYCPVRTLPTLSATLHCWAVGTHPPFLFNSFLKSSKWSELSAAGNS